MKIDKTTKEKLLCFFEYLKDRSAHPIVFESNVEYQKAKLYRDTNGQTLKKFEETFKEELIALKEGD